jgi:hypothetical protein
MNGLLVASRSLSATHEAPAAVRVMPPVFAMGQAAGTADALAIEYGTEPRAIPVPQLLEMLVRQKAYLGDRYERQPVGAR